MSEILVCGGRDFTDRAKLFNVLSVVDQQTPISMIVHGAAAGADALADEWAKERGIKRAPHPAKWNKYRAAAGLIRNREMLALHPNIQLVIAFPGGLDTRDMAAFAEKAGKLVMKVG